MKWEYYIDEDVKFADVVELGLRGWELIAAVTDSEDRTKLYFKRPLLTKHQKLCLGIDLESASHEREL